jgi:nicotinamidase-related amidase
MTKTTAPKTAAKGPKIVKSGPAKSEPTMEELLAKIKAAKEFTVFVMVGGQKLHSTHPTLKEAGQKALSILKDQKKRPLVSAIGKDGSETVIIETVWKQAASAPAKKPKAEPGKDKAATPQGKRAAVQTAAEAGILPPAPDFTANTHARFRPKLEELKKLVAAKDIKGLKAFAINPVSSSPKALDKFRNLSVIALEAQAKKAA